MTESLVAHKEQIRYIAAYGVREADEILNDYNRRIIKAIKAEYGEAYLGNINYQMSDKSDIDMVYKEYVGQTLYNFCARFVVPYRDRVIEELVLDWRKNSSTKALDKLMDRIEEIGGYNLFWS